jgi:hypothetical protein
MWEHPKMRLLRSSVMLAVALSPLVALGVGCETSKEPEAPLAKVTAPPPQNSTQDKSKAKAPVSGRSPDVLPGPPK